MGASHRICSLEVTTPAVGFGTCPVWKILNSTTQYNNNNNTVNTVNVAGPPQTQVGCCKTNDRKNLKNYSGNEIRQSNLSSNLLIGHLSGVMDCMLSFLPRNSFLIAHCNYLCAQKTCTRCFPVSPLDFCVGFFSVFLQCLINNPNLQLISVLGGCTMVYFPFGILTRTSLFLFVLHQS